MRKSIYNLLMLSRAFGSGGGSGGSGGGVSPEEVTAIVKEQFPGGVGYSKIKRDEVLLEEQELEWGESLTGLTANKSATVSWSFDLVDGMTMVVRFDGVDYECVTHGLNGGIYFGNMAVMDDYYPDTGEPFIFVNMSGSTWVIEARLDKSCAVGVKVIDEDINTISSKFISDETIAQKLPSNVVRVTGSHQYQNTRQYEMFYVDEIGENGSNMVVKSRIEKVYFTKDLETGKIACNIGRGYFNTYYMDNCPMSFRYYYQKYGATEDGEVSGPCWGELVGYKLVKKGNRSSHIFTFHNPEDHTQFVTIEWPDLGDIVEVTE